MSKKSLPAPNSIDRLLQTAVRFPLPSKTVTSAAYETNINNMVAGKTPFTQSRKPLQYVDETLFPSTYEEAFNLLLDAENAFMELPPEIREAFHNSPAALSAAFSDPSKQSLLQELGLVPKLGFSSARDTDSAVAGENSAPPAAQKDNSAK